MWPASGGLQRFAVVWIIPWAKSSLHSLGLSLVQSEYRVTLSSVCQKLKVNFDLESITGVNPSYDKSTQLLKNSSNAISPHHFPYSLQNALYGVTYLATFFNLILILLFTSLDHDITLPLYRVLIIISLNET
jgi:hypothetical protein